MDCIKHSRIPKHTKTSSPIDFPALTRQTPCNCWNFKSVGFIGSMDWNPVIQHYIHLNTSTPIEDEHSPFLLSIYYYPDENWPTWRSFKEHWKHPNIIMKHEKLWTTNNYKNFMFHTLGENITLRNEDKNTIMLKILIVELAIPNHTNARSNIIEFIQEKNNINCMLCYL